MMLSMSEVLNAFFYLWHFKLTMSLSAHNPILCQGAAAFILDTVLRTSEKVMRRLLLAAF